jgi:hypothetical protein
LYAPTEQFWNPKTSRKYASTSQTYAKKKAAKNPAKCAPKPRRQLDRQTKKNTLTYAHKAALNAEKLNVLNRKKTLMWHNSMTDNFFKGRKN